MLKVIGPEATNACQYEQIYARLEAVIDGDVHCIQAIWDANSSTENWGFLLVKAKSASNEITCVGMPWTVFHLWPSGARF